MLDDILGAARRSIPKPLFRLIERPYHFLLAWAGAARYGFPSRRIAVIAVTGTKGKSSTTEILNAILEKAGLKTALSNTIRFKIGGTSRPNLYKMSMPGRFALQKLLHEAVHAGCTHFVMEMTSQGALLYRHRFIELDMLVFTNLSPEHIEAHGSFEAYKGAKLAIARNMARSGKRPRTIVANADDAAGPEFLACTAERKIGYGLKDAEPYMAGTSGLSFAYKGRAIRSPLSGMFNLYNILAAMAAAEALGVPLEAMAAAVEGFGEIPGRVERIEAGQPFEIVVDYAHTPDSLEKLYRIFQPDPKAPRPADGPRLIAVLGGTGGGRDAWKRAEMGRLADLYCDSVILTDEDPYDEDPRKIVADVAAGVTAHKPLVVMDRREAIREAVKQAKAGDTILITGKGTDPYIMGPNGAKTPWSDAKAAREEAANRHA